MYNEYFQQGYDAFHLGFPPDYNPYNDFESEQEELRYEEWDNGWNTAFYEYYL
jgi:hypothetical protein